MRILSEEIWQRLNAHTAFFLSTAVLASNAMDKITLNQKFAVAMSSSKRSGASEQREINRRIRWSELAGVARHEGCQVDDNFACPKPIAA